MSLGSSTDVEGSHLRTRSTVEPQRIKSIGEFFDYPISISVGYKEYTSFNRNQILFEPTNTFHPTVYNSTHYPVNPTDTIIRIGDSRELSLLVRLTKRYSIPYLGAWFV